MRLLEDAALRSMNCAVYAKRRLTGLRLDCCNVGLRRLITERRAAGLLARDFGVGERKIAALRRRPRVGKERVPGDPVSETVGGRTLWHGDRGRTEAKRGPSENSIVAAGCCIQGERGRCADRIQSECGWE